MTHNALTLTNNASLPSPQEWTTIRDMAQALLPTGFLPAAIKTPEQAVLIILKGRELGIPALYSLSNIVVIQGKPTANAELMLALVQRDHGHDAMWVDESTNESCTVCYKVNRQTKNYSFTIDDAKRAGLKTPVWAQYPAAMLRARAISAVARMAFPGSIGGLYSPGELGDNVTVTDDGEVISVSTGEITRDNPPVSIQEPRQRTKAPAQVSATIETESAPQKSNEEVMQEQASWDVAIEELDELAGEHHYSDELLQAWAKAKGFADLNTATSDALFGLIAGIRKDPEALLAWGDSKNIARMADEQEGEA